MLDKNLQRTAIHDGNGKARRISVLCRLMWEPEGVVASYAGTLQSRALLDTIRQIQRDPRFDDAHYLIHDFLALDGHDIGVATLTELAGLHYAAWASSPNCRVVFVTQDAALANDIRRVLCASELASYDCAVCHSLVEARDWLDAQPQLMRISDVMGCLAR